MATIIDTNFVGANNSAWPAPWQTAAGWNNDGAATIQNNRGQLSVGQPWGTRRAVANLDVTDFVAETTWRRQTGNAEMYATPLAWRASPLGQWSGDGFQPPNGYFIYIGQWDGTKVEFSVAKLVGGVETEILYDPDWLPSLAANTDVHIRVQAIGNEHKAYLGLTPFDGDWTVEFTDSSFATGRIGMALMGGQPTQARTVQYGPLLVTEPPPPVTPSPLRAVGGTLRVVSGTI